MSHDLWLTDKRDYCEQCKRDGNVETLGQTNVSYNHCWIWYDKFDKERGFRAMYNVPIDILVPRLEQLKKDLVFISGGIPTHEMNTDGTVAWSDKKIRPIDCNQYDYDKYVTDDGWAMTHFNAYRCIEDIFKISWKHIVDCPNATWYGD